MYLMSYLISLIGVLLSVAFLTLMERKIMGLCHYRKGPSKLVISGVSQPVSDAMKLLTKETIKFFSYKKFMYSMGPLLAMSLALSCWYMYSFKFTYKSSSSKTILLMFSLMGMSPFSFILMGWGSNSKYALLGSYRAVSQVISYEVCFICTSLVIIFIMKSFSMNLFYLMQNYAPFVLLSMPLFTMWMTLCLSESNRTPFDHAESESELVSGFNVEYGGGLFALIFIAEYGMILFLSFVTSMIFLGLEMVLMKTFLVSIIYIWCRCAFPRVRYDKLMYSCWKIFLPYSIMMVSVCTFV